MSQTLREKDNYENPPSGSNNNNTSSCGQRKKQLKLENKYKLINDEVRQIKESGITSKEVTEKSKLLRKTLKHANELSKLAFEIGSQKCIEADAEYFVNGSEVNHSLIKALQVDHQTFEPLVFAEKLITFIAPETRVRDNENEKECGLELEDFAMLGKRCSYLINSVPTLDYIYGSFDPGEVVIPTKQRRAAVTKGQGKPLGEIKKPNSSEGIDENDDLKNGKEVERLLNDLQDLYTKNGKEPVQYFKAVADPKSFCKTVENVFYSAFLIKEGVLVAKEHSIPNDKGIALLEPLEDDEFNKELAKKKKKRKKAKGGRINDDSDRESNSDGEETATNHQSILSFCEDDWKKWKSQ